MRSATNEVSASSLSLTLAGLFIFLTFTFRRKAYFDLTDNDDAVTFQCKVYNFASVLETAISQLDVNKCTEGTGHRKLGIGHKVFAPMSFELAAVSVQLGGLVDS
ncbi:hypothetical protein BYT27DRAFT_7263230 [Phlegmacium glaucopus]|nr:hypothetical protein BYT27DRAFT_7263230 [Phlegmacium glaucopus]